MDKKSFTEKLKSLLEDLDFNEKVKIEALDYIYKNYDDVTAIASETYLGDWDKSLINRNTPYDSLMVLMYKIVDLDRAYCENVLPRSVLIDTLSDLTLRQKIYFDKCNKLGLNEEDISWLKHIYDLNIFKLGSLQYELAKMTYTDYPEYIKSKEIYDRVPEQSNILKVHIRRNVDLSKEAVDESFNMSKRFFRTYYPDYNYLAYTCGSWMLYSKNNLVLSPKSNILNFASRFELFYEEKDKDMAIKYIFGAKHENFKDYPQETSLQINALKNLESLGVGYGVIYIRNQ